MEDVRYKIDRKFNWFWRDSIADEWKKRTEKKLDLVYIGDTFKMNEFKVLMSRPAMIRNKFREEYDAFG